MFHTFIIRHPLFHYLCLSTTLLLLSGCAEDFSALLRTINTDTLYQAPSTSTSTSNTELKSSTTDPLQNLKIIGHPESVTVYEQQPLTLTVNAQSSLPIYYQWYKNNLLIAGANQPSYHISKSQSRDQGYYHVVVKNKMAEIRSLTARVTYRQAPSSSPNTQEKTDALRINEQPASQNVAMGSTFSLSVSAQSTSQLRYQWYRNDFPIFGAISPTYTVLNASTADQGRYSVLVRDSKTTMNSSAALITVNDSLTAAIELSWDTPHMREDGSPLKASEIQAYIIQYGRNFYDLAQAIKVPHQTENRYILRGINPGMLYLRIATLDSAGYRGAFSQTISVWIN